MEFEHRHTFDMDNASKIKRKALVIQGGGSHGAFTVGRLYKKQTNYDVAVGSSTGALIASLAIAGEYEKLRMLYGGGVRNQNIYSKYPFLTGGIPKINMALWSWIVGKKGITDTQPLRNLIKRTYTEDIHKRIIDEGKQLWITVCELNSLSKAGVYCEAKDFSHSHYCDLIWASTLVPGLIEPLTIVVNGQKVDLVDGGTVENVGLKKVAYQSKCTDIDVFLHEVKREGYKESGKNWVHNLIRALVIQRQEVVDDDINLDNIPKNININKHYLPFKLVGSGPMEFDPLVMATWFKQGLSDTTV